MTVRKYRVSTVLYYLPIIYYLLIYLLYSTVPGVAIYTDIYIYMPYIPDGAIPYVLVTVQYY